jgi:hypothetical protein
VQVVEHEHERAVVGEQVQEREHGAMHAVALVGDHGHRASRAAQRGEHL